MEKPKPHKFLDAIPSSRLGTVLGFILSSIREASDLPHSADSGDCLACTIIERTKKIISIFRDDFDSAVMDELPRCSTYEMIAGIGIMAESVDLTTREGEKCSCREVHTTLYDFIGSVFGWYSHYDVTGKNGPKTSDYLKAPTPATTIAAMKCIIWGPNPYDTLASKSITSSQPAPQQIEKPKDTTMSMAETKTTSTAIKTTKTAQKESDDELYTKFKDVSLERGGNKITLPDNMSYRAAHVWLERMEEAETKKVAINELIDAHPMEGAKALAEVLDEVFGFTDMIKIPGDFFTPDILPTMHSLEVGFQKTVQVPWGRISVPQFGAGYFIETSIALKGQDFIFKLEGEVMQRDKDLVAKIAELTRKKVREHSIYRGKAIYLNFPDPDDKDGRGNPKFNINNAPSFMNAGAFDESSLVFSKDLQDIIETNIIVPITKTQLCRDLRIPLKRGILLEGPYGTGKTLTANMTAKKAVENGWTFLYLQNPKNLSRAIRFAAKYQPAVIFMEDVDRVFGGDRDEDMNNVLNTLDGIDTKSAEVMVVLTTNHLELFNRAALRPGRLDAVISVSAPDAEAVKRLLYGYASGKIESGADLTAVCEKLANAETIPAVIREVVERAKLGALRHATSTDVKLRADDLMVATNAMMAHLSLVREEQEDTRETGEKIADSIQSLSAALVERIPAERESPKKNGKSHATSQA